MTDVTDPSGGCRSTARRPRIQGSPRLEDGHRNDHAGYSPHAVHEEVAPFQGRPANAPHAAEDIPRQLLRTIARDVLPTMIRAHRRSAHLELPADASAITSQQIVELARLSMLRDGRAAVTFVGDFQRSGYRMDTLCLNLLSPTARLLGELWVEDRCSFLDVTVGLGRLQQSLFGMSLGGPRERHFGDTPQRVLLAPGTNEQHTFGLQMVAEFFRRDGWEVTGGTSTNSTRYQLCRLAKSHWFDAIGFSAGSDVSVESLYKDIRAVRGASCNRIAVILVGGPVFDKHPELVSDVGADAMTSDAQKAPLTARQLVALATQQA